MIFPPSAGPSEPASRDDTKSLTSSFSMTSKTPSQAIKSQSPAMQPVTVLTSGTADTLHFAGAMPAGLK
eukprot:CAMPEP_0115126800 /NCGR_PEP_ID=MMETSP0227-20121206/49984_1 /TAXON_ID=89957 /ORGANISM="Polarella glacialis, Strain CCMP 1383" /LENGTH=68 /DNA_ID=CAMNT_0002530693 /DNA_START=308 /DNA_END=514 /DNA_ORIENTATION=-